MSKKSSTETAGLRSRPKDELLTLCNSKVDELQRMRFKHAMGQLQKTHSIGVLKKEVARMMTVLSEVKAAGAGAGEDMK